MTWLQEHFVEQRGIYVPKRGSVGGKSEGRLRARPHLASLGYAIPKSLMLPVEVTAAVTGAFTDSDLLDQDEFRKEDKIEALVAGELKPAIDAIMHLFPERCVLRSSDVNEDSFKTRLSGMYTSVFVGRREPVQYEANIKRGLVRIFRDYLSAPKSAFRMRQDMQHGLGLLVDDAVGRQQGSPTASKLFGEKFFPDLAGYISTAFPDKVLAGFCAGFGSIAVDGADHVIYEYSRASDAVSVKHDYQSYADILDRGSIERRPNTVKPPITPSAAREYILQALRLERLLGFPQTHGLDLEFATPAVGQDEVFAVQTAPMPVVRGHVHMPVPEAPLIMPGSYIGVGERLFTHFAIAPANHFGEPLYHDAMARFNETHKDYLLFVRPEHIWMNNKLGGSNGTFTFTNTYNAGGIVEVMEGTASHGPAEGATHFANFNRAFKILFMSGEATEHYRRLFQGLSLSYGDKRILTGTGQINMVVDENRDQGVLDLRSLGTITFFEG